MYNFYKLATKKGNDKVLPKRQKKMGVTNFVLGFGEDMPGKIP